MANLQLILFSLARRDHTGNWPALMLSVKERSTPMLGSNRLGTSSTFELIRSLCHTLLATSVMLCASCTPIAKSTSAAYFPGSAVDNTLDAVILARNILSATRLGEVETPKVRSVEELSFVEASRRISSLQPQQDRSLDARLWLVVFQGTWQWIPPDPAGTITPTPPFVGCAYALFAAADGEPIAAGLTSCAK